MSSYTFEDLCGIIEKLRAEDGCPWDRVQTHESLRPCMIEEAYEAVSAINHGDMNNFQEELGDVMFQVLMHSEIARGEGTFTLDDVIGGISEKMIRRHPHVFGDGDRDALPNWDEIKRKEKEEKNQTGIFDGIPEEFPALIRSQKILKRLEKERPELREKEKSLEKLQMNLDRMKLLSGTGDEADEEELLTEMLFYSVNLLRLGGYHAEQAFNDSLDKIVKSGDFKAKNLDKDL